MWKITKNAFFKSNVILTKPTTFCKIIMSNIVGMCLRQVEYFAKKMTQYFFDRKPSERSMFFCGIGDLLWVIQVAKKKFWMPALISS